MKIMKYTSPRGRTIEFDDYVDETKEYGTYWVEICPSCHNKYKNILRKRFDDSGSGEASCSVKGCKNTNASYYVDFEEKEVKFIENKGRKR